MKNVSPQFMAVLESGQFFEADLYEFALVGGDTYRYCSGDQGLQWNGQFWSSGGTTGPYMPQTTNRALGTWNAGLEAASISFYVNPGDGEVGGLSFVNAVRNGLFDGASFNLYRAVMTTYGDTSPGTALMFSGRITEISPAGRSSCNINAKSWTDILNTNLPHEVFQAGCLNTLGDSRCTIDLSALAVTGTVAAGSTAARIQSNDVTNPSGYFSLGKIMMTSGVNEGQLRFIRTASFATQQVMNMLFPFPNPPAPGDTFTVYPGCDKTMGTCLGTFANLANFRAQPFTPENSTAV